MKAAGLVLAAGLSSRMGAFKPLLPIDAPEGDGCVTVLERAIRTLSDGGVSRIFVVTGHNAVRTRAIVERLGATEIYNKSFMLGMAASITAGIRAIAETDADGLVLLPCDSPAVPAECVSALLAAADTGRFAVPCYQGKKGHPLWIPRRFFAEILRAGNVKTVTRRWDGELLRLETGREGVVLDMDSPGDYQRVLDYLAWGETDVAALAAGRRIFMVRHGETVRHPGPVFMGQYNPPLSSKGFADSMETSVKVAELSPKVSLVYTSDLLRARVMADMLSRRLRVPVSPMEGLREMSLGVWDGRLIEDVARDFPDEYARRGEALLSYKPQGGESFYDLRYRVSRCLADILKKDDSPDILLVTHSGVIRSLISALTGAEIDEVEKPPLCGIVIIGGKGDEDIPHKSQTD